MEKVKLDSGGTGILMELKDLRIGNLLEYKGEFVHVTSLSMGIDDEYNDQIGFCKIGENTNEVCDWNRKLALHLKPVPIDVHKLSKINFEIPGIQLVQVLYGVSIQANQYIMDEENEIGSCEYIHELQNLHFALTNTELKIAL